MDKRDKRKFKGEIKSKVKRTKGKRDREIAEKARQEAEEKARQREAQIRADAEREKQEALKKAEEEKQKAVQQAQQTPPPPKVAPKPTDDGKMIYTVQATFEIKTQKGIPHEKIEAKLDQLLKSAGITTCIKIEVLNA